MELEAAAGIHPKEAAGEGIHLGVAEGVRIRPAVVGEVVDSACT
jgi:hypothetical protein